MMRKLDAFEQEMNAYAATQGGNKGEEPTRFVLEKKARLDMIQVARETGESIESIIDDMRVKIKEIINRPAFFMETKGSETLN